MLPKIYKVMFWFSISLAIASVIVVGVFGLKLGVDFKGGSVMEFGFKERPSTVEIQNVLRPKIGDVEISSEGDKGVIIRTHELTEAQHQESLNAIATAFPTAELLEKQFSSVGPVIGNELKQRSLLAILLVLVSVVIYIAIVFRKIGRTTSPWAMGLSAIVALFHDIIIPVGVFSILGHYYDVEVTAVFLAAALTILGYSVSDSVIIFDRVRENVVRNRGKENFGTIVHHSVLQTLTRSLNSTMTTLLALIAIFFFGGESIKYFSLALIIGIFLGAYSSIFVASPLLVWWTPHTNR